MEPATLWFVLVLLVPLFLWLGLGNRDLWAPDEPRYALVAQEMIQHGSYVVPTVNGEVYAHKPPLFFWFIALFSKITGVPASSGFIARLPSALSALLTLFLTGLIAREFFDRRVTTYAIAILATSHMFCWQAHAAQIDSLLTALIVLSIFCGVRYTTTGKESYRYGFFLAASLATLAKGPVGILIPFGAIAIWRWRTQDRERALFTVEGFAVLLAPLVFWLVLATLLSGTVYVEEIIGRHVVKRYLKSWHHIQPWYYYLHNIPENMMPWGLFIPAALVTAIRAPKTGSTQRGLELVLCWFFFMLAFFSATKGKRGLYMLPAAPALAILIAWALDGLDRSTDEAGKNLAYLGFAILPSVTLAAALLLPDYIYAKTGGAQAIVAPLTLAMLFASIALIVGWKGDRIRKLTQALLMAIIPIYLGLYGLFLPSLNPHKSVRKLAEHAAFLAGPNKNLGFYGDLLEGYVLYAARHITHAETPSELARQVASKGPMVTIMQIEKLEELREDSSMKIEILEEHRLGSKNMILAMVSPGVNQAQPE